MCKHTMLTKDKIIEIFCIADDFCKEFDIDAKKHRIDSNDGKKHRNRSCTISDSEMITILLCFHFGSFRENNIQRATTSAIHMLLEELINVDE